MPTKTDLVKAKLAKNPSPDYDTIKEWAKEGGYSPSLVYKWIKRMPAESRVVSAGEPVVIVEEEPEIIVEEATGEESEVPSFEEEPSEAVEEEATTEIVLEEDELDEQERRLRDIAGRAISRIFDVVFKEWLDLTKVGLTQQECDDTNFLVLLMVVKYMKVEVREYMLEFTASLHFGSIGLKVLVAWLKKRAEEKEKEKPVPEVRKSEKKEDGEGEIAAVESTDSVEKGVLCVACKKQPVAEDSKENLCLSCQKKAQKAYIKKITGGNF